MATIFIKMLAIRIHAQAAHLLTVLIRAARHAVLVVWPARAKASAPLVIQQTHLLAISNC